MRKLLFVLSAAVFMVGLTVPAMSQPPGPPNISDTWTIDGRVGLKTYYTDVDEDRSGLGESDSDLSWTGSSSRVRLQYKTDALTGYIETAYSSGELEFKNYYAEMNMGSWFLLLGVYDPLSFNPADGPSDKVTCPVGVALGHKKGGILRGRFPMGMMTLSVALIEPDNTIANIDVGTEADTDVELPAIEVKTDFVTGGIPWALWGGYQTYDSVDDSNEAVSVDSYIIGGVVRPSFGPVKMNASLYMEQNKYQSDMPPYSYPIIPGAGIPAPEIDFATNTINEIESMGFHASAGYTINQQFGLWAGFGYVATEDDPGNEVTTMCYYASLPIQMNKNFRIIPYITYYDAGDVDYADGSPDTPNGTETVFGAYWEVVF